VERQSNKPTFGGLAQAALQRIEERGVRVGIKKRAADRVERRDAILRNEKA
jgi:hypothetical protein